MINNNLVPYQSTLINPVNLADLLVIKNKIKPKQKVVPQIIDFRENLHDLKFIKKEDLTPGFSTLLDQARSVAWLAPKSMLSKSDDHFWSLETNDESCLTPQLRRNFATGKRPIKDFKTDDLNFRTEPALHGGTGFLVGKASDKETKYLVTAAHCVCDKKTFEVDLNKIKNRWVVFDYCMNKNKEINKKFSDVYEIKEVVKFKYDKEKKGADWALIELTKTVKGRTPLEFEEYLDSMELGDDVYMQGHPECLPCKYTHSGKITKFKDDDTLFTTLQAFPGNSGSPVFNSFGKVIGIQVRGYDNYYVKMVTHKIATKPVTKKYPCSVQNIKPVCETLNSLEMRIKPTKAKRIVPPPKVEHIVPPPKVEHIVPPPMVERILPPPKGRHPSPWQEIKQHTLMPIQIAQDFIDAPSIEGGFCCAAWSAAYTIGACILGPALVPVAVTAAWPVAFGVTVVGLGTTAISMGIAGASVDRFVLNK